LLEKIVLWSGFMVPFVSIPLDIEPNYIEVQVMQ
jgi:hypothetical protein